MSLPRLGLFAIVSSAIVFACAGLKVAEKAPDEADGSTEPPGSEDGGGDKDAAPSDTSTPDAGDPPADFECASDPWTKTTKTKKECAPRQVRVVDPIAPIDPTGVSIARTPAGRVGIVYNGEVDAETGEMLLAHFVPSTPTFGDPTIVKRSTGFSWHDGYLTKIAATGPDTLHVLAHDVDDSSRSGEVRLYKLVNGTPPLTNPEVVVTGAKYPSEIGFAVDAAENAFATIRLSTGTTTAKLSARKRAKGEGFTALPDITTALLPNDAPGAGSASLIADPTGQVHLLYHHNEVTQHSNPRYHSLDGASWSYRKTVDNAVLDGLSGFSPRLAVFGTKKFAAYYFRKALQSAPVTADLRLATWESSTDTPQIEIIDQGIPSNDALSPTYRVAMAVDKYGLVHLAMIRPTSASNGYLEYRRQTKIASGTKWLSDIVDPDVLSNLSTAFVDIVVDANARPHIAYRSAKDGKVKYATRFDR